jgi:hypothetical protein
MKTENYDCKCKSCILVEGPAWGDAKYYGRWLIAAAKANELLQIAKKHDAEFLRAIDTLETLQVLDFGIMATVFLSHFADQEFQTFVIDVDSSHDLIDFVLMIEMGFFTQTGNCYQMTLPSRLNLNKVKQAHLKLAATEDDEWIHPERFIVTMSYFEAKKYQRSLRTMSEEARLADRRALLFLD